MHTWSLVVGLLVVLFVGTAALILLPPRANAPIEPTNFAECVAAGYPVMESYPRQCNTPSGQHFVEEIDGNPDEDNPTVSIPDLIVVSAPAKNQTVSSPVTVTGSARGPWYFEATFPIDIKDATGKTIGQGYAEAQSEWMTTDFVLFTGTVPFTPQPTGSTGIIILHKANASGDPERDQSIEIPVTF